MGKLRFFDPAETEFQRPADTYPASVLPLIPEAELLGSRVRIHHPGTAEEPQLIEVELAANLTLAPHSHRSSEIIAVVQGELLVGARTCGEGCSVLVEGETLYSVTAGPDGARFLNFRGRADYTYLDRAGHVAARAARRAATSPAHEHLVTCRFRAGTGAERLELRAAHLDHLMGKRSLIAWGGVLGDPESPVAVCIVVRSADEEGARDLVDGDPYRPLYESVSIERFSIRLGPDDGLSP